MTRRWLLFAGAFLSAVTLAFILRDVVEQLIILPLAYLWWLLRLYYSMFPQTILWVILVVAVVFSAITSLMPELRYRRAFKPVSKPAQGQIEILVDWLEKARRDAKDAEIINAHAGRLNREARDVLEYQGLP